MSNTSSVFGLISLILVFNTVSNVSTQEVRGVIDIYDSKSPLPYSHAQLMTFSRYSKHPCNRECKMHDHKTCYYNLVLDYYKTWGHECRKCPKKLDDCYREHCAIADNVHTSFLAINYMFPGPKIEACYNDTLVIDVHNRMLESSSIHWHGLHQKETPYMDGVPYVTQNPINPGETFRYQMRADRPGTLWYHSHSGMQRAFGLSGTLIVRQPKEIDPHSHLYNYDLNEHVIFLSDWAYNFQASPTTNILINGKGRHQNNTQPIIYSIFNVQQGESYRFRTVFEGYGNCQLELSIDHHKMKVISSDGNDIKPLLVESITILSGERYDFVLEPTREIENYWIRVRGSNSCGNMYQGAILHYEGAPAAVPEEELHGDYDITGVKLNPIELHLPDDPTSISTVETESVYDAPWDEDTHFKRIYLPLNLTRVNGSVYMTIDDIASTKPGVALLPAKDLIDGRSYFSNRRKFKREGKNCKTEFCQGLHVVKIKMHKYVEMIVANNMNFNHPMHLHGYTCQVVGQGKLLPEDLENIEELDRISPLPRKHRRAPWKDTVQVYGKGYTILRFKADNPGFWLYHCHIEIHAENGMIAVFQVGDVDDMISVPEKLNCEE